jgi:hypothetical protein
LMTILRMVMAMVTAIVSIMPQVVFIVPPYFAFLAMRAACQRPAR